MSEEEAIQIINLWNKAEKMTIKDTDIEYKKIYEDRCEALKVILNNYDVIRLNYEQNLDMCKHFRNTISEQLEEITKMNKIIDLMLDTLVGVDSDNEIVKQMAQIETTRKKERIFNIYLNKVKENEK